MKKAIADLWVKALRSGEYKQGRNQLRSPANKFCCLGVLCNLHAQAHPEFAAEQRCPEAYDAASTYLPCSVRDWAGMVYATGGFTGGPLACTSLAVLNDQGSTFEKLADVIEQNWRHL